MPKTPDGSSEKERLQHGDGHELVDGPLSDRGANIEAEVAHTRKLVEAREYERALANVEALHAVAPLSRDVLFLMAVSQRRLKRIAEALSTLARLESLHPRFSRLFQERGLCYVTQRDAPRAIEAFEHAVHLCPDLPASWKALKDLYGMVAREADSARAAARLARLDAMPREIVTASVMFADGDVHEAERIVRQFLLSRGDHVEGMRLLAKIGMKLDILDDPELLLESLLTIAPDYDAARYDYVMVLLRRHKHLQAAEQIARLVARDPANRLYRTTEAAVAMGLGKLEEALSMYRELSKEAPQDPELYLSAGHALKTLGRNAESIQSYRAAVAARPDFGEAYWSLANLKTYRFTDTELARMRDEEAATTALVDRYHLCFALGKALEDRGEYAQSFEFYQRGNTLKESERPYPPEVLETSAGLQRKVCTKRFFEERKGFGCKSAAPIFIVGLPRAGSTLLEQILASHSKIEGTTELADIHLLVQDLQGREHDTANPRYPGVLADLRAEDFQRLGEKYLTDTAIYRRTNKTHFIDKNPNNFRHLGFIHLSLPHAKIIDARRNAMACCFSNYKQLFAVGQRFTYSLEHIAGYYKLYAELMRHWEAALPGKILRVRHEDVVNDLEGSVRRILEFCGLEFEDQCLRFHENERSVNTASSEQVRQPIYREGLDQWRHFEPWLGSLRAALGTLAEP